MWLVVTHSKDYSLRVLFLKAARQNGHYFTNVYHLSEEIVRGIEPNDVKKYMNIFVVERLTFFPEIVLSS